MSARALGLGLLLLSLVGACSSDDDSSTTPGSGGSGGNAGASGSSGSSGASGASGSGGSALDGGTDGAAGADGSIPPITFDQLCASAEGEMCSWLLRCRSHYASDCPSWWGSQNVQQICKEGKAAVAAGHLLFDGAKAAACLADAQDFICENGTPSIATLNGGSGNEDACFGMLTGTRAAGSDCEPFGFANECVAGHYCKAGATCPGKCTAFAPLGGACDFETPCNPAEGRCAQDKCVAWVAEGSACSDPGECVPGLACRDTNAGKRCVAVHKLGESCGQPWECGNNVCDQGKCALTSPSGGACAHALQCPATDQCVKTGTNAWGSCAPRPGEGMPCQNGECAGALSCSGNVCTSTTLHVGADCTTGNCDAGTYCKDTAGKKTCAAIGKDGDDCSEGALTTNPALVPQRCETPLRCVPKALDAQSKPTGWECRAPRKLGEPCNPAGQLSCSSGYCSPATRLCTAPSGPAGECVDIAPASCASGAYCAGGVCAVKGAIGAPCSNSAVCESGACDQAGTGKCVANCTAE